MKIKNVFYYVLLSLSLGLMISCDASEDYKAGKTSTGEFAGDWYIGAVDETNAVQFEHELHYTYNTAANDNTMWIDDHGNGYEIKCKVTINSDGTFSALASDNYEDLDANGVPQSTVTITNGKIEKGAASSKAGHAVDKISFKANFSYDAPTTIISYEGHKRTGFLEDEY